MPQTFVNSIKNLISYEPPLRRGIHTIINRTKRDLAQKLLSYRLFIRHFWKSPSYGIPLLNIPIRPVSSGPVQRTFSPSLYVRSYRKLALARSLAIPDTPETLGGIFANHCAQPLRVTQTAGLPPARYSLVKSSRTYFFFYPDTLLRLYT